MRKEAITHPADLPQTNTTKRKQSIFQIFQIKISKNYNHYGKS
ncbi:MAG: hypothetical protein NZ455_06265 [Bacteroidia bacterium]|nr:hypothetical protein [Bacteroidia bacterium]MDW8346187.1 hypothetical protein [Bacteroidia bacterium]